MADEERIAAVEGVGPKIAHGVREFFSVEENLAVVERLLEAGVVLEEERGEQAPQTLAGLTFVLTGTLSATSATTPRPRCRRLAPRSRVRSRRRRAT